jgi:3-oxoisoapionate decarboxylase
MSRRDLLWRLGGLGAGAWVAGLCGVGAETSKRSRMGVVIYALSLHQRHRWAGGDRPLCISFLEQCHRSGAGGIQYPFTAKDAGAITELRRRAEQHEMFVEAILELPDLDSDLEEFEGRVRTAKAVGAVVARTVMLPGRRYEQFTSYAGFKEAERNGLERLRRVEPIVAKHRFGLAVENHKDQLVAEKLETLRRIDSEYIGLCVDVGNNFPLLEDPVETIRAFAPFALTVHLKDQAVLPLSDGFLMADVALGQGCLDLAAMVDVLRTAKPGIRFNFETITRDPLSVPVLSEDFWATLPDTPARDLARVLSIVKNRPYPEPFVTVSRLTPERQLELELQNLEISLDYAREHLGL